MKNKIVPIILSIMLVIALAGNIILFNKLVKAQENSNDYQEAMSQLVIMKTDLDNANETITTLQNEISDMENVISTSTVNEGFEGNGGGETLTEEESDYAAEAEALWAEHEEEFDCNYETFREYYVGERLQGESKEEAYNKVYEMFKKVVKQPKPQTQQPSTNNNGNNSNNSGVSQEEIDALLGDSKFGDNMTEIEPGRGNGAGQLPPGFTLE